MNIDEKRPQPKRKSADRSAKVVGWIIILFVSSSIAAVLYPILSPSHDDNSSNGKTISCLSNIKQLALGFMMYSADNNCYMPITKNWQTVMDPYFKSRVILICPSTKTTKACYAFNTSIEEIHTSKIRKPASTVMLFESVPGMNQYGGKELLPSPPRHLQGHSIGFVDGHVKSVHPDGIDSLLWDIQTRHKKSTRHH